MGAQWTWDAVQQRALYGSGHDHERCERRGRCHTGSSRNASCQHGGDRHVQHSVRHWFSPFCFQAACPKTAPPWSSHLCADMRPKFGAGLIRQGDAGPRWLGQRPFLTKSSFFCRGTRKVLLNRPAIVASHEGRTLLQASAFSRQGATKVDIPLLAEARARSIQKLAYQAARQRSR